MQEIEQEELQSLWSDRAVQREEQLTLERSATELRDELSEARTSYTPWSNNQAPPAQEEQATRNWCRLMITRTVAELRDQRNEARTERARAELDAQQMQARLFEMAPTEPDAGGGLTPAMAERYREILAAMCQALSLQTLRAIVVRLDFHPTTFMWHPQETRQQMEQRFRSTCLLHGSPGQTRLRPMGRRVA